VAGGSAIRLSEVMAYHGSFVPPEEDPRPHGDPVGELATYREYLTHFRLTLELKCRDLTPAQLATASVPPSDLSLLGLVRHLARVEYGWFFQVLQGHLDTPRLYADDPTGGFRGLTGTQEEVEAAFAAWREQIAAADAWLDALDEAELASSRTTRHGGEASVRDIMVHLVEEYARHCGHADLLRECIDGRTGQ
jgi:uncharacterized damage-inducible protein DinB